MHDITTTEAGLAQAIEDEDARRSQRLGEANYKDLIQTLCEFRGWRLSEQTVKQFFGQISGATNGEFEDACDAAFGFDGHYTPAQFVSELRAQISRRIRTQEVRRVRIHDERYAPCPDGLARINRLIESIRAGKPYPRDRAGFGAMWLAPVTEEEMLSSSGKSLQDLITTAFGPTLPSEGEWEDA